MENVETSELLIRVLVNISDDRVLGSHTTNRGKTCNLTIRGGEGRCYTLLIVRRGASDSRDQGHLDFVGPYWEVSMRRTGFGAGSDHVAVVSLSLEDPSYEEAAKRCQYFMEKARFADRSATPTKGHEFLREFGIPDCA